MPTSFIKDLKSFDQNIWLLIAIQSIEKLAFVVTLIQIPIYIAQKDIDGGLYLGHDYKGYLLFAWAIVQRLTPLFTGSYSDRFGYKPSLYISTLIIIIAYITIAYQQSFPGILMGVMLLGLGSGIFLPSLQGALASNFPGDKRSSGWGMYFMLLNFAVFFAPPISKYLKELDWHFVFLGSAIIISINIFLIIPLSIKTPTISNQALTWKVAFRHLFSKRMFPFLLAMSGFTIIYMQFYETYPNFFIDWIDSRSISESLNVPQIMLNKTQYGYYFSYEWIRNINSAIIVIFIGVVSTMMAKFDIIYAVITGLVLSILGLALSGISTLGSIAFAGIVIYTFGELITNPKFTQFLNDSAPEGLNATYMSFINFSYGIGLSIGALLGGFLYNAYSERAMLAARYLLEEHGVKQTDLTRAYTVMLQTSGMSHDEATALLWTSYSPWIIWIPFVLIGTASILALIYFYKSKHSSVD